MRRFPPDPDDATYRRGLVSASSSLSWLLATTPDPGVRDGARAVQYGTKTNELTDWKDAVHVEVLAAAYAATHDFAAALKRQKKALELLSESKYRNAFQSRLALYQARKPYRAVQDTSDSKED